MHSFNVCVPLVSVESFVGVLLTAESILCHNYNTDQFIEGPLSMVGTFIND